MGTFNYTVTVECETEEQANRVITERIGPDEDYGFPYGIEIQGGFPDVEDEEEDNYRTWDGDDYEFARETLGEHASPDEIAELARQRAATRARERTDDDEHSSTGDGCTCGWRCDLDGEAYTAAYLAHLAEKED